jgi:PAS domain S-box-containing protein
MEGLGSAGIFFVIAGAAVMIGVLVSASLASRRRQQLFGSEESLIPVNLASTNDAVLVATVGGRIVYANEVTSSWFNLDSSEPDLWRLSQQVEPAAAFLELFAAEGQATFRLKDRNLHASSHRVAVGDSAQFVVSIREEKPLPTLDKEDRGSGKSLQVLSDITRAMNASLNLEETLQAVLTGTTRLIVSDTIQICLWEGERERLTPAARSGPEAYVAATHTPDQFYLPDQGYAGYIARKRQPLLVPDAAVFREVLPLIRPEEPPVRSYIGVPLSVRNRFIGTLEVTSSLPNTFGRDDEVLLTMIAEQAAGAIQNARQYSQQAERVTELSGLQKISQAISTLQDAHQLFTQLGQRVAELMKTQMAGVLLFDREQERLTAQRPLFGVSDSVTANYHISLERGSPARILWEDVSFWFSNDVLHDRLAAETGLLEMAEKTGVHSTAMALMRLGDEKIGVLQVSNKTDGAPFTLEDIRLLEIYAGQSAIVVESARLYSEEQNRVAELQGLQQIVQAMSSFSNPEELYGQLTARIAELMKVDICGILVHDPDEDKLVARVPFFGVKDEVVARYEIPIGRRGLAREIWREHEQYMIDDSVIDKASDDLKIREISRAAGFRRMMFAALSAGGRRFGLLQVANPSDDSDFTEGDLRLLSIFAGQAAALIENARLYEDTNATLRKRAAELRSVSRISHELNATLELERILEVIAVEALRAEGARWGNLVMFEWVTEDIVPTMRFGTDLTPAGKILIQAAARSGESLVIDDFERMEHYPVPLEEVRCALVTPITFEGKVVGAISLYGDTPRALSANAVEYVQALSSQATIAVTNATRHAEQVERSELLRRRADQLTQLFELGRMFRSDQSLDENLNSVARAISDSVGFSQVVISILDPVQKVLHHTAAYGFPDSVMRRLGNQASAWETVEKFFQDDWRTSGTYLVQHTHSAELFSALGLPQASGNGGSASGNVHSEHIWSTGNLLLVPLRSSSGDTIGMLTLDQPRDGLNPTRNTIELLEIFANQAAIVLENSRLYQRVEERAEELQSSLANLSRSYEELDNLSQEMIRKDLELSQANELLKGRATRLLALHRVMESVDSTHGPDSVLQQIALSVIQEMDIDHCVIAVADADGHLEVIATSGKGVGEIAFKKLIDGEDPLSVALAGDQAVTFLNLEEKDKRSAARWAKQLGARAMLALPIHFDSIRKGALLVGSARKNARFGDDDRDLFNLLASQIVVEYENARLYQAVQSEAATTALERDRLQHLHVITTALQQTGGLEDRLHVVARGIHSVGWQRVAILLMDENLNTTSLVTAGYEEAEEASLRKRLLPGEVWQRRLSDQQFMSLRVGSSYFLPYDHPWVTEQEGRKDTGSKKSQPVSRSGVWHPRDQLYLPMYAGSHIMGMISLRDPASGQRPDEAGLRPLELFAQQAASALENTRLYQETLELQSYNEAVLQSIQQGILVTDLEGNIETVNAFLRDQYHWGDEAIGHSLNDIHPAFKQAKLADAVQAAASAGHQIEGIDIILTEIDDDTRQVKGYVYPRYDEEHAITGAVVLIEDVTQRARLEADIARRGEQLAALSDVSRRISAALTVGDVVKSSLEEAVSVIPHDKVALWLRSSDDKMLRLSASQGYKGKEIGDPEIPIDGHKLFDEIVSGRLPVIIPDARATKRLEGGEKRSARSWLGAPLITGGNVTGVMVFEKTEPHAYAPADGQVAAAFANQVAVALENARLFEEATERAAELDSRNQRLNLLNRISSTIGRSLDQNGILQTTVDELASGLNMPQAAVYLFDQDNHFGRLTIQYPSTMEGTVENLSFELSKSAVVEQIKQTRQPVVAADAPAHEALGSLRDVLIKRNVKSALLVPLIVGTQPVGLISIESTGQPADFGTEQIELAQTITNQAAVSVQNARLFQETVARQRELSILFEAGRIASSSLDLDKVVNSAAGYFVRALEVDGCMITLVDQIENRLTPLINVDKAAGGLALTEADALENFSDYPAIASAVNDKGVITLSTGNADLSKQEKKWLKARGVETALIVPLVARDQTIALAELWLREPDRRFSQRDIRLARALATSAATAMENARLLDEAQQRLGELATINEISRAMTQTISSEDLFHMLQEQVGQVLKTQSMTIATLNPLTGQVAFPLAVRNGLRIHMDAAEYGADLYSTVMESRQPLLISRNVADKLRELGVGHSEEGLKSFLSVPLLSGEKVLGALAVENYQQENAFREADLRVLSPIGAQVSVSLENTRLYGELEQRLSETTTLQEVSRVVNSALNIQEIFERVVSELATAFKYPLIALFSTEESSLKMRAYHGFEESQIKGFQSIPREKGIVGRAVRTGQPQLVLDVTRDSEYLPAMDWVRSEIAVPIISDQTVLGVLDVQSGIDSPLDDGDLQLMRTFASQVATAMSNASLYAQMVSLSEELEKRVEERTRELTEEKDRIDILYKIAVELTASLDLDLVLNNALKLVGEAVGAEHGSLFLVDPQSDRLIFRAVMSSHEILPPGGRQIQLLRHEGLAGWVMDNRESIVVDNVQYDPRWANVPGTENRRSMIGTALVANDEVLGCIFFASDKENIFKDSHLTLVEAAAQQVAVSINNAELYRLIRDQAERLGAMLRSQQTEAAKSQAILESVADGVMVSDAAGEIILFNAAAERILELRREEVLGRSASELTGVYGAGAARWNEMLNTWSSNPTGYTGEYLAEQIEIGQKVVSVHVSPAVHGDDFVGLVSVFRDITREVIADRVKSEFVATVSHELRTPMTSIKGYADLLLMGAAGEINADQRRFLEVVKGNADRLSFLVNDLLDISRIEQGGVDLDYRPIDLGSVVKDVVASVDGRRGNEGRSLQVTLDIPPDLPTIEGDYDRITQVVLNVVGNAYQYTPDDGSVTIRATPEDTGVRLDVIDTGIGIEEEDKPRIFERFFRGEDPMVMKTSGTGLGMSITHHLVKMHNGEITFESELGKGTTFTIRLPYKQDAAAEVTAAA